MNDRQKHSVGGMFYKNCVFEILIKLYFSSAIGYKPAALLKFNSFIKLFFKDLAKLRIKDILLNRIEHEYICCETDLNIMIVFRL